MTDVHATTAPGSASSSAISDTVAPDMDPWFTAALPMPEPEVVGP